MMNEVQLAAVEQMMRDIAKGLSELKPGEYVQIGAQFQQDTQAWHAVIVYPYTTYRILPGHNSQTLAMAQADELLRMVGEVSARIGKPMTRQAPTR